jgi:hypothetical protein
MTNGPKNPGRAGASYREDTTGMSVDETLEQELC